MIRGKNVLIRPMEDEDQQFVSELNLDPAVRSNVVGWDFPQSLRHQQAWFRGSSSDESTHRWIVTDTGGLPLGLTGLWGIDWHDRNALTALKLGGPHASRGRGIGRDAIKAVMAFAFYDVGLHRLHSTVIAGNSASTGAYVDHCGWQIEGVLRHQVWRHGGYCDLLAIGVLKDEFDALPDAAEYVALVTEGRVHGSQSSHPAGSRGPTRPQVGGQ